MRALITCLPLTCLLLGGLTSAFAAPAPSDTSADSSGLLQAQEEVRRLDPFQQITRAGFPPPSLALQVEDPTLLEGLILFEKGTAAFLAGRFDMAEGLWVHSQEVFSAAPSDQNPYGRRTLIALAMRKMSRNASFEDTFQLLETVTPHIRNDPLPADSTLPHQQRLELAFVTADDLFHTIHDMSAANLQPSAIDSLMAKSGASFLSDIGLYQLLAAKSSDKKDFYDNYEQVVDALVFRPSYGGVSSQLAVAAGSLCQAAPGTSQGAVEALALLWGTQLEPLQFGELSKSLPPIPEGRRAGFAHEILALLRLANDASQHAIVRKLWLSLSDYESALSLLSPEEKIDLAQIVADDGNTGLTLRLLREAGGSSQDPGLLKKTQLLQLKICAENSHARETIALGEAMLNTDPTGPHEVLYFLALGYARTGDSEMAIQYLTKFIDSTEDNTYLPIALELLGKMYLNKGQSAKASGAFKQLMQFFPDSPSAERYRSFFAPSPPPKNQAAS